MSISQARRARIRWAVAVTAVVVLAACLRFAHLGKLELWLDECGSVLMAASPQGLLHELARDNNPPLYFLLLKGWMAVFGLGEVAVRAMSAVIGVLTVAALGFCLHSLGLPGRAVMWSMLLCAVAPLQIRYSQEARPYILTNLMLILALWSLCAAIRDGRWWRWGIHACLTAAALYTHDLMLSIVPALWIAAWAMGADRRQWTALVATHAAALIVYAPWFALIATQPKSSALEWIVPLWRTTPPMLAIPRSLEAFGIGGFVPPHVRLPVPEGWVRFAALAWWSMAGLAALSCLLPVREGGVVSPKRPLRTARRAVPTPGPASNIRCAFSSDNTSPVRLITRPPWARAARFGVRKLAFAFCGRLSPTPGVWRRGLEVPGSGTSTVPGLPSPCEHKCRSQVILLLAFLLLPLAVPFVYSLVRQPIYVVGRYDFIAHPAWLAIMGIGMWQLQTWLGRVGRTPTVGRMAAGLLPAGVVAVLAVRALAPIYAPLPAGRIHHPQTERGLLLGKHATKDDLVVCLGQEGAKIGYQMMMRDIPADMLTFPLSTRRHFGWFNPREVLEQDGAGLTQEAHAIVAQVAGSSPRYQRLWLAKDPYSGRPPAPGATVNYYSEIADILYSALGTVKWKQPELDTTDRALADSLGIEMFAPAREPR